MNDLKSFFATTTGKVIGVVVVLGIGVLIGTHGSSKSQPVDQSPQAVAVTPVTPPSEVTPSTPVPIVSKPAQSTSKKTVVVNNPAPVIITPTPAPVPAPVKTTGILSVGGGITSSDSIKQGTKGTFFTTFDFYPFSGESVINSITVTRTGSSQDSDIGDIYLVDYPYGKKIFAGPQRLNSNHQVTFTGPWTFKHGDNATGFAIQADVAPDAATGDIVKLPITAINTSSTLQPSSAIPGAVLPIDGLSRTITAASQSSQPIQGQTINTSPQNVSGSGQQATQKITLQSGLAIFTLTNNGQSNFIVQLLDSNGTQISGSLANEIGSFSGSTALHIDTSGSYLFNVKSDGSWTINVQQPQPSQAPQTTNFSGHGKTATALFSMPSGLHTISMTHNGQSNFIVSLLNSNGSQVGSSLSNEIGAFNGSTAVSTSNGIYLFNVNADGDWTISIQ